jgi:hypothetical protein
VLPRTLGSIQVTSNNRWITTLAARFGVTNGPWLFYGKAGGGWVGSDDFTDTNLTTGHRSPSPTTTPTAVGWWARASSGLLRHFVRVCFASDRAEDVTARNEARTHVILRNSPPDQMEQMVSRVLENRSHRRFGLTDLPQLYPPSRNRPLIELQVQRAPRGRWLLGFASLAPTGALSETPRVRSIRCPGAPNSG